MEMEELEKDKKIERDMLNSYQADVDKGHSVEELMKHPAFKLFKEWIDSKAIDAKGEIAKAKTQQDAWDLVQKIKAYQEVANWFSEQIIKGKNKKTLIENHALEQKALEEYRLPE